MNSWIAINLRDFHDPRKRWQRGTETMVEAKVIGGKNLEHAKRIAQCNNNDPWQVFRLNRTDNIVYKDLNK